jgi:aminomethyltransferase
MNPQDTKKTLLYDWHTRRGANMAVFGGYDMPVWYPPGVRVEHLAPLTTAGIFDTSHMALVKTRGARAFDLLQRCFSRDLGACIGRDNTPIAEGRCVYGVFLNEKGHVIDDAIVYKTGAEKFVTVVNAGMGGEIAAHLKKHAGANGVDIEDLTDRVGKMDVQGPLAAKIMQKILADPHTIFEKMPYFSFKGHFDPAEQPSVDVRLLDGTPMLISRSGYTGEFGFELFIAPDRFVHLWETVLEAGKEFGALPCGLAARDSLRVGAVLPLSHQDIGHWPFVNNPWTFALPYNADKSGFTKAFVGGPALENVTDADFTHPFVGYDLRKITVDENAAVLNPDGERLGIVLTCATDMGIGRADDKIYSVASPDKPAGFVPKGLCCGFVKTAGRLSSGQPVQIADARRKIKVVIADDIRPDRTARRAIRKMI